jgi:hypothetical protein
MSVQLLVPSCNRSVWELFQTDERNIFMQYAFSISHMFSRTVGLTLSALLHLYADVRISDMKIWSQQESRSDRIVMLCMHYSCICNKYVHLWDWWFSSMLYFSIMVLIESHGATVRAFSLYSLEPVAGYRDRIPMVFLISPNRYYDNH